jgi:branched-chain amino acid transport system substrate-binding protein
MRGFMFRRVGRLLTALVCIATSNAWADIVLGHSGDLSGNTAALTTDYVRGMNAYFDDLNKKGGIRGEKIKLISMDDGFNPDKTLENTKALIEKDNVVALVGYRGTANLLKIMPTVQAAGIAEIGNTAGAKSLRDPHVPGIFHVRASTTDEIEAAVNHAWTIGINRIAAMYQDDAFGKEGLEAFVAALKKRGATPAAVAPVPRGTADVVKAVDVIAAVKPQAVMLIGQAKPSVVREYQTIISQTADKKFSYNSMEGFLNAKLAVRAIQKTSGPVTRAKIIAALESMNNEDLGGFTVRYGKQNNLGSHYVNLTMIRADGSFAR